MTIRIVRTGLASTFLIVALAVLVFALIYWRGQAEYSDQQRARIAQWYRKSDAMKLSQCVDVCKVCLTGNDVTCNTSCRRGAILARALSVVNIHLMRGRAAFRLRCQAVISRRGRLGSSILRSRH